MAIVNQQITNKKTFKSPILESLDGLFYVSKFFGIIPYSLSDYITKKRLQLSSFGCAFSVLSCIFYVVAYHILMSETMVEKNPENKISTLTAIIGMFIIYLEPFMMTIDIVAALINQTALIDVFDRLQEIDNKLEKENVYLDNRQNRFTSTVFLITFIICEIGIGFAVVFVFREEFSIIQALSWVINCVPLTINVIAKTWFLMLILLVQSRLRAINTYLNEIKRSFQERKLRHVKAVESKPSRKDNLFMETVGYLETEIYSTTSGKIDGWNYWEGARNNKTNKVGDVNNLSGIKSMKKIIQVAPYKGR